MAGGVLGLVVALDVTLDVTLAVSVTVTGDFLAFFATDSIRVIYTIMIF